MAATLLSHQSSTGFYKAPVCKGLMGSVFLAGTAINIPMFEHLRQYLACEVPSVLMSKNIWRILFNRLTFIQSRDIICSAFVIYYFRIFERRMGSRKFASFLFGSCTITTLLEICMIMLLKYVDMEYVYGNHLLPGLYGIVFPLYVYYFLDIPKTSETPVFSGKTITYFLGLQIAVASPASVCSSLCGIVAGIMYRYNFLHVQKWLVVPNVIAKFCDKIFGRILASKEPKYRQMGATIELQRQEEAELWEQQYLYNRLQNSSTNTNRQVRGQGFAERLIDDNPQDGFGGLFFRRRQQGNSEPSPENIRILVDMGFEQSRAIEALRSSSNDLETATSILLRQ